MKRFTLSASSARTRRRAFGMNQVHIMIRELGDQRLVMRDDMGKFLPRPTLDIEEERDDPDAFGQDAAQFLDGAGAHGRLDIADDAAPGCESQIRPLCRCENPPKLGGLRTLFQPQIPLPQVGRG